MSKLYLDMKYIGRVPAAYRKSAAELAADSGMNLGNFVFRHALYNILEDLDSFMPITGGIEYQKIIEKNPPEQLIISCANWLGQTARDEQHNRGRADAIEKCKGSVTVFGLGTQAGLTNDGKPLPVKLGPETQRLAKVISERSASISARDELTAITLKQIGVTNVVVTGCPSNYLNPDSDLGEQLSRRAEKGIRELSTWEDVRLSISEANDGHGASGEVLKHQLQMLADTPAFYVVQTPDLLDFAMGARTNIPDLYRHHNPFVSVRNKLTRTMKSKILHFADVDAWMDFSRTCDMSIGMRIHGTMVPLQSGTPSILVGHDSRTSGLAETMGVPLITPEEYLNIMQKGPKFMLSFFIEKIADYDRRRRELAGIMFDFLKINKLRPHPSLAGLSGQVA